MPDEGIVQVKRAMISVSDKTDIEWFAKELKKFDIEIISTGGTAKSLADSGVSVTQISDYTGFPEIMGGRVKTLHPKIHGGILSDRDNPEHAQAMRSNDIQAIDMVVINLYPFENTVAKNASFEECIENIDIGGPAMIRASAKNHKHVCVVTSPHDYRKIIEEMKEYKGGISEKTRKLTAYKAFSMTARYDNAVSSWLGSQIRQDNEDDFPLVLNINAIKQKDLRYGENPHQKACVYVHDQKRPCVANAIQIQGKEMSYNNYCDGDAAYDLVREFESPAVAIIKHANPCGVAQSDNLADAYQKALACDPISAFGGIIALNRELDAKTAELISKKFVEVVIAPAISKQAKEIIAKKENIRVLVTGYDGGDITSENMIRQIEGGFLLQQKDNALILPENLRVVTKRSPSEQELRDLLFAAKVCKHVKSNAIVYAKNGATVGIGAGQMSRVDSCKIAINKSIEIAKSESLAEPAVRNSVVASDAFFPFADGLSVAVNGGATAAIQPGGSKRDDEVIKLANEKDIAMIFTGIRNFRH